MHDVIGQVSVARCAELLSSAGDSIDRSALSRYCDAHDLKKGKRGREVLVDYEEVRQHRAANYTREVMSGAPIAAPPAASPAPAPRSVVAQLPGRDDPARQLKEVQLRTALREEAEQEGLLTSTSEVDAGAADAVSALRAAFAQVTADHAEVMAAELHLPAEAVRPLRAHLKSFARAGQTRFAEMMANTIADANEEGTEAYDRLMALTAIAIRLRGEIRGRRRAVA